VEIFNPYDVNNDGSVDISDVVSLVNFILDSSTTNSSYDVNGDGNIDISDVVALVNMILGQQ
jgi:Ca2+-binding EF-hand superfamily protein